MQVDLIDNTESFARLQDQWSNLLATSNCKQFFLTHEFLFTWWQHIPAKAALTILATRERSNLTALAPFMISRSRLFRMPIRRIELIGSGWGYGGILCHQRRPESLDLIFQTIATMRSWHVLQLSRLRDLPPSLADRLLRAFPESQFVHETTRTPVPYIPLHGTWDEYLADRSTHFRRNLRNRARRLREMGRPTFLRVRSGEKPTLPHGQIIDYLAAVSSHSWKAAAGTAITSNPRIFRYYSRLVERLGQSRMLDMCILLIDGRPAAYVLGATYNGQFVELDICYDDTFSGCSPGKLTRNELLKDLFGNGLGAYDFVEHYEHKLDLTSSLRNTVTHTVYRRALYPSLLRLLKQRLSKQRSKDAAPARRRPLDSRVQGEAMGCV